MGRANRSVRAGDSDFSVLRGQVRDDSLALAPICIPVGNHHVKAPMAALFFGLHQSQLAKVEQIAFDETNLLLRHAAPLQVNRKASQMRRRCVAFGRGCIAVVAAEFLLTMTVRTAEFT